MVNLTTLEGSRASLINGRKSVMVLCMSSVWPSHQQVTLWCNGLHSRLVRGGPEFDSYRGRVVTDVLSTLFLKVFESLSQSLNSIV